MQMRALMYPVLLVATLAVSCTSDGAGAEEGPTEDSVDRAWVKAAECLTDAGYSVEIDRAENTWAVIFEGEPDGFLFDLQYDRCVGDAEQINLAFLRTQIPEGAERLAVAAEFQSCLSSAGLDKPIAYDADNPDSSAALADAIQKLGYSTTENPDVTGGPDVADDPRFREVLICFDKWDGQTIRRLPNRLRYDHQFFTDEPMLWIADGIAYNAGATYPDPFPSWHHGTTKV